MERKEQQSLNEAIKDVVEGVSKKDARNSIEALHQLALSIDDFNRHPESKNSIGYVLKTVKDLNKEIGPGSSTVEEDKERLKEVESLVYKEIKFIEDRFAKFNKKVNIFKKNYEKSVKNMKQPKYNF